MMPVNCYPNFDWMNPCPYPYMPPGPMDWYRPERPQQDCCPDCRDDRWSDRGDEDRSWRRRDRDTRIHGNRVDLDGNGKFRQGSDGLLVLDFDKDGKIDAKDVRKSKEVLRGYDDPWDVDDSSREALKDLDSNGDGKLDADELKAAKAEVWVDADKDGKRSRGEVFEADDIETRRSHKKITSLDLESGNIDVEDK